MLLQILTLSRRYVYTSVTQERLLADDIYFGKPEHTISNMKQIHHVHDYPVY